MEKISKRIAGSQQGADKHRARLGELERLLGEAEVELVEAEARKAGSSADLVSQGLGGGAACEDLRKAAHVPECLRGSTLESQLQTLVDLLAATLQAVATHAAALGKPADRESGDRDTAAAYGGEGDDDEDMGSSIHDGFADGL